MILKPSFEDFGLLILGHWFLEDFRVWKKNLKLIVHDFKSFHDRIKVLQIQWYPNVDFKHCNMYGFCGFSGIILVSFQTFIVLPMQIPL
jgi:hypothetical protein